LRTSILTRHCGPLCEAVADRSDASDMLAHLERTNLFLSRLDGDGTWFRYHPLFQDFLRERRQRELSGDQLAGLHRRASAWFERNGSQVEAIEHALSARDWERAARLLERWMSGPYTVDLRTRIDAARPSVLRWVSALPDEVLLASPRLTSDLARSAIWLADVTAETRLYDLAERAARLTDDQDRMGEVLGYRAMQAFRRGEYPRMRALAEEGLRRIAGAGRSQRAHLLCSASLAYAGLGWVREAGASLDAADTEIGPIRAQVPFLVNLAAFYRARLAFYQGHLRSAHARMIDHLAHLPDELKLQLPGPPAYVAAVAYEWNDLAEARRQAEQAFEAGLRTGRSIYWPVIPLVRARLCWASGRRAAAVQILEEALTEARRQANTARIAVLSAQLARFRLAEGDLEAAEDCLIALAVAGGSPRYEDQALHLARACLAIARARAHPARADLAATLAILAHLDAEAAAQGRVGDRVECLALTALAHQAAGSPEPAQAALAEALRLGEPEGFMRTFLDEGPPMANLLRAAADSGAGYAQRLRAAFAAEAERGPAPSALPEALTEREHAVLRLLAEGRSMDEVAERLVISAHTVRTHLRNIYNKLDAHNRMQAIDQARRLGLL
jgi:LuxR family maltose regulon positive regulatory protein